MSIKTIDKQIKGSEGVAKKINKGAERMVFDILQSTQYSTPIPSTVRELATNGCDAQREKEIAIEILTGEAKEEDYYIKRDGAQYADSNFDIGYYDINHLDAINNDVTVTYKENEGTGFCDTVTIQDHGVGIGQRRLEGVLELGYSTKRNTSENFGAFGLGAKAALSTGVDFYTIETVHNGKKFKCNCYNYKTDFIVPSFTPNGPNPHILLSDGTKVHYEETDELNGTKVSFQVKRHHRREYRDAVEEQLMYLTNVRFIRIAEDGHEREEKIQPNILYNSDNLIISDTYVFSKPHIVLTKGDGAATGVNYGFVDFRELEMQQMWGPIAFKCPARQVIHDPDNGSEIVLQEGVDVTPSREKVIWNENTKKYILSVIEKAALEATDLVQKELEQEDFISWLLACKDVLSNADSGSVIGRIANIIDKESIKPKFKPDPRIKNESVKKLFAGFKAELISVTRNHREGKDEISRDKLENYSALRENNIFIMGEESHSKYKDLYLQSTCDGPIICLKSIDVTPELNTPASVKLAHKTAAKRDRVLELLTESSHVRNYDDIEIDEEWLEEYKDEAAAAEEVAKFENISPSERRKLESRMVAYSFRFNHNHWRGNDRKRYILDKVEPKIKDLMKTQRTTYYGTKEDEDKLMAACGILHAYAPKFREVYTNFPRSYDEEASHPVFFFDTPPVRNRKGWGSEKGQWEAWSEPGADSINLDWTTPQIIRVAQNNIRHISMNPNVKHIDDFFLQLTPNGGYTMDEHLIKWYTADKMKDMKNKTYLYCLKEINPDLYEKYKDVYTAVDRDLQRSAWVKDTDVFPAIEKLVTFHKFCNETDDAEAIKQKSRELFVLDVPEAIGQDQEMMDKYNELTEWTESVHVLLNAIDEIKFEPTAERVHLDDDLIKEIKTYLDAKGRLDW
tara:strand:+ start:1964 stop:4690 length:2727 start_codon:yes stop_codon:yes gene_type:complete